jgi:Na+-translocating ferredoxin:NAD+ oxidoreductase RNF subunit RnfB
MKGTLKTTGVLRGKELLSCPGVPTKKRMKQGPVAIIECVQEIPCDPSVDTCRQGAISIGEDITQLPQLIEDKCTGCGICIAGCPGQAIFVVDLNYSKQKALLMIPYEFYPLPKADTKVKALDREGKVVGEAKVLKVMNPKKNDRTPVISLLVPRELAMEIRNIRF